MAGLGANLTEFENVRDKFITLPVYSIKEDNNSGEILIRKGPEENRTHFIHVMQQDGARMQETIKFRDLLRNNPEIKNQYAELKCRLAKKYPHDRKQYTASKSSFIQGHC